MTCANCGRSVPDPPRVRVGYLPMCSVRCAKEWDRRRRSGSLPLPLPPRRNPQRLPTRRNPDVFEYAQAALMLTVGAALLTPGADGLSAWQHISSAIQSGVAGLGAIGAIGAPGAARSPSTGAPPTLPLPPGGGGTRGNAWGPGNGANGTAVNINTAESWGYLMTAGTLRAFAHVGFGHVGAAQQLTVAVWAGSEGIAFGAGAWGPVLVQSVSVGVGNDADWTGYGVDVDPTFGVPVDAANIPQTFTQKLWATIYGPDGQPLTTAQISK